MISERVSRGVLAWPRFHFVPVGVWACWALQQANGPIMDLTQITLQTLETLVVSNVICIPKENDSAT